MNEWMGGWVTVERGVGAGASVNGRERWCARGWEGEGESESGGGGRDARPPRARARVFFEIRRDGRVEARWR